MYVGSSKTKTRTILGTKDYGLQTSKKVLKLNNLVPCRVYCNCFFTFFVNYIYFVSWIFFFFYTHVIVHPRNITNRECVKCAYPRILYWALWLYEKQEYLHIKPQNKIMKLPIFFGTDIIKYFQFNFATYLWKMFQLCCS